MWNPKHVVTLQWNKSDFILLHLVGLLFNIYQHMFWYFWLYSYRFKANNHQRFLLSSDVLLSHQHNQFLNVLHRMHNTRLVRVTCELEDGCACRWSSRHVFLLASGAPSGILSNCPSFRATVPTLIGTAGPLQNLSNSVDPPPQNFISSRIPYCTARCNIWISNDYK